MILTPYFITNHPICPHAVSREFGAARFACGEASALPSARSSRGFWLMPSVAAWHWAASWIGKWKWSSRENMWKAYDSDFRWYHHWISIWGGYLGRPCRLYDFWDDFRVDLWENMFSAWRYGMVISCNENRPRNNSMNPMTSRCTQVFIQALSLWTDIFKHV